MYQALYRKWRPSSFDDVIGQEHITASLKNQVSSGHLSHAYLFIGTRGTGKTTCARILARAVNCEHPVNGNPCGECESCRMIASGGAMDVVELDAASNNGVDNVRALREEAVFSPSGLKKRVYIIDEVHMLSISAFNALLKILEEPPEHLMFILATTELQKIPATILSRCQRHSFRRIDRAVLKDYLLDIAGRENLNLTGDAADLIAGLAEGGVRDALSMLDQCSGFGTVGTDEVYNSIGLAGNRATAELFEEIAAHDAKKAVLHFAELYKGGKDPASLLRELASLVRDVLMMKLAPEGAQELVYGGYDTDTLLRFASGSSVQELSSCIETIQNALGAMKDALNPKMSAELCIVSQCSGLGANGIEALKARVERLEESGVEAAGRRPKAVVEVVEDTREQTGEAFASEDEEQRSKRTREPATDEQAQFATRKAVEDEPVAVEDTIENGKLIMENEAQNNNSPLSIENSQFPADFRSDLLARVLPKLGRGPAQVLESEDNASFVLDDDMLRIETVPGFYRNLINRPEVLDIISAEASALAGKPLEARVFDRKEAPKVAHDLGVLRQFPEVTFIN